MSSSHEPAKLSDGLLTFALQNAFSGVAMSQDVVRRHIDTITAENARLARERDDWKASFENQSSELRRLSDEMADHEDAIEHLRSIGKAIGCNHVNCPDERAMIVRCVEQTVEALQYQLDLAANELIETKQQLAAAQQRLAALAVDPAKREELGAKALELQQSAFAEISRCSWKHIYNEYAKEGWMRCGEGMFNAGRLEERNARDTEVSELKRRLACIESEYKEHKAALRAAGLAAVYFGKELKVVNTIEGKADEANKQLAEMRVEAEISELVHLMHRTYSAQIGQKPDCTAIRPEGRKHYEAVASAVAARVRAPLVQQIAELTKKLEAAEKRLKVNELDMIATANETNCPTEWEPTPGHVVQLVPFGRMRAGLHKLKADRDRLAAELALYAEACGQLSDLVDELESTLEDEETSHQDTIRIWDIAKEQLATTKQALADKASEVERLLAATKAAMTSLEYGNLASAQAGLKSALAAPAAAEPPVAEHSGDVAEKVDPAQPDRRFKCPICGCSETIFDPQHGKAVCANSDTGRRLKAAEAADSQVKEPEANFACPKCGCEQYGIIPPYPFGPLDSPPHYCGNDLCDWRGSVVDVLRDIRAAQAKGAAGEGEDAERRFWCRRCKKPLTPTIDELVICECGERRDVAGVSVDVPNAVVQRQGFKCPKCGHDKKYDSHPPGSGVSCASDDCGWSGTWEEVYRKRCETLLAFARAVLHSNSDTAYDGDAGRMFAELSKLDREKMRQQLDAQRQRADAAEASAAAMRACLNHVRRLVTDTDLEQFTVAKIDKALATDAGSDLRAELERLRGFVEKIRQEAEKEYAVVRGVWIREELATLDQAAQPAGAK